MTLNLHLDVSFTNPEITFYMDPGFFFPSFSSLMASVNLVKSCSMFPENSSGISLFQSSDYKSLTFIMNISAA